MDEKEITERIIGCAFKVHRSLGAGFLEKVYENALLIELNKSGLHAQQQAPVPVLYEGQKVGEYFADLLVEKKIVCELKAVDSLGREHEVQLVNYLTATGLEIGLLINFGKSVTVKRKFKTYTNSKESINPVNPE
ncbi:MAG: GxxExxY protein [Burkholderiales bacterium]